MALLTLVLPVVLAVSGCACTPVITTKIVEVPVMVTCIKTTPTKPEFPFSLSLPDEDLFVLSKRAIAEIELRKSYEGELEAVLIACKSTKP